MGKVITTSLCVAKVLNVTVNNSEYVVECLGNSEE